MADLVKWFGGVVDSAIPQHPAAARRLLLAAYRAKGAQLRLAPEKELSPARRQVAQIAMDAVVSPLAHPDRAALVNIFMPCELLQAFGLLPMFAEAMATYLNGAGAEKGFIDFAEAAGVPETYCSYHKALMGEVLSGVLPKPLFTACTSLACDANNLTFRRVAQQFHVPEFYIDVPYECSPEAVQEVAQQLRGFASFLAQTTGRPLDEDALRTAVARSRRTLDLLSRCMTAKAGRYLANDVTSEFYEVFVTHTLLGTPQAEAYAETLLSDLARCPRGDGIRLLWMHSIPFYQAPVRGLFNRNSKVQLVSCDMSLDALELDLDPAHPYESMARRLVYNSFNGGCEHRIVRALEAARRLQADGIVYFCHWGCKQTLGAAQLVRTRLEAEGFPVLLLDGDGCDRANTSDGQTATRLGAFVEMLEARKGVRA